jgi:hypothetical protein
VVERAQHDEVVSTARHTSAAMKAQRIALTTPKAAARVTTPTIATPTIAAGGCVALVMVGVERDRDRHQVKNAGDD